MRLKTHQKGHRPGHRNRTGSILVETVVSLFIFALFITGACKVIMSHRQLVDKSRDHYTAVNIAKNQIEQIRNTLSRIGYDQIYDNSETEIQVGANGEVSNVGKFRRTTIITTVNDNMSEIEVTVEILNRIKLEFGTEKEILQTYIARPLKRS